MATEKQKFAFHPSYQLFAPAWKKCRDAAAGEDCVKEAREEYLPRPSGFKELEDYQMYLRRACFYGATGRTVEGLSGVLARKPPTIKFTDDDFLEHVGPAGEPVWDLIQRTIRELLIVGRVGHLVDAAPNEDGTATVEPYVVEYCAEDILNWRTQLIDGRQKLVFVVLREEVEFDFDQFGKREMQKQFRVLRLSAIPGSLVPVYVQEIYRYNRTADGKEGNELIKVSSITPTKIGGRLWEEIPFIVSNPTRDDYTPEKPPLLDLVNVNYSHYMNSADLEWGRHFTALPTPWIAGIDDTQTQQTWSIGASQAWTFSNHQAKVGMLEFSGAGLGHLQEGMSQKEKGMAVLGSRLLEEQKAGVEAAEALSIRSNSEGATLTAIGQRTGTTWTHLLHWLHEWRSAVEPAKDAVQVQMNLDFNPRKMPSDFLIALMQAVQQGTIGFKTWYEQLSQGEVLRHGMTYDQFVAEINEGLPGATDPIERAGAMAERLKEYAGDEEKEKDEKEKKSDDN